MTAAIALPHAYSTTDIDADIDPDTYAPDTPSAAPLLASVLSLDTAGFFDALVGRLQRLLHEQKVPGLSSDSVGQVLRALLSHEGWHSNRVWAGIARLAAVAEVGQRTVRRVLAWFREIRIVREVYGEELLRGPGPQDYPREKKTGLIDTTCYDLSGLLAILPRSFHTALETILAGDLMPLESVVRPVFELRSVDELIPDPFAEPEPAPEPPPLPEETKHPDLPLQSGLASADPCLVSPINKELCPPQKTPVSSEAQEPFTRPDLAPIKEGRGSAISRPRIHLAPGEENTAYQGLRKEKIGHAVALQILTAKGVRWTNTLLAYGRWTKRKKSVGPGWFVEVWKQSDDTWPDDFLTWYAREKAAAKRLPAPRKPHKPGKPRQSASAPESPPTAPEAPVAPWTPEEYAALLAQTVERLRGEESLTATTVRKHAALATPRPDLFRGNMERRIVLQEMLATAKERRKTEA